MKDVNAIEFIVLAALAVVVIAVGVYPDLFVSKMQVAIRDLIACVIHSKVFRYLNNDI